MRIVFLFTLYAVLLATAVKAQDAPDIPSLEKTGRAEAFPKEAEHFLKSHANSPHAPRVRMDVYLLAIALKETKLAERMKREIIFKHPESIYARYLLETHKKVDEYLDFLNALDPNSLVSDLRGYYNAVRLGYRKFGGEIFSDATVVLTAALAANDTNDKQMEMKLLKHFRELKPQEETSRIADISFFNNLSYAEQFVQLHQIKANRLARILEQYCTIRMTPEELVEPKVLAIRIENHLKNDGYREALALITQLNEETMSPKYEFWTAWCHVALREYDKALPILEKIQKKAPDGEWGKGARVYSKAIRTRQRNLEAHAEALVSAIQTLKNEFGIFESTVQYRIPASNDEFDIYLGIVPENNFLDLLVRRQGKPLLILRVDQNSSWWLYPGESEIVKYKAGAMIPIPKFDFDRAKDGQFELQAGINFSTTITKMAEANANLLNSKYLTTKQGMLEVLEHTAKGGVPMGVRKLADGNKEFAWIWPVVDSEQLKRMSFTIDSNNHVRGLNLPQLKVTKIQYGKGEGLKLNPPVWPDIPVVEREKLDIAQAMKLIGAIIQIFAAEKQ